MQRCPKCGRTYENDTQKFCTHDGGRLEIDTTPAAPNQGPTAYDLGRTITDPFDPEETVTRLPDLNKTVATTPTTEIRSKDTGPATAPPPSAMMPQQPPQPPVVDSPYQPSPPAQHQPPPPPTIQATVAYNPQQQQPPQQPPPPPQQHQYYQPQPPAPPVAQPPHQQQQYSSQPLPHQPQQHGQQAAAAPARAKSSRLPLILGLVAILLIGGAAAWYFLIYKKGSSSANTNSNATANTTANSNGNTNGNANTTANANTDVPEPPPPPNSTKFVNSSSSLDGKLAEKYSDFSFYYPSSWEKDPKTGVAGASNFIRVERRLPPDFTQENFTVSWYDSKGTLEADKEEVLPKLVESLKGRLSKAYPEFEALSEGETEVNGIKGYELRFESVSRGTEKGDITLWGRVVFLPPGKEGESNGVQLLMLTTSLAPELQSADDIGVKGELPVILNSFRLGGAK